MPAPDQLALPLPAASDFSAAAFHRGPGNAEAFALIQAWPVWPARVIVVHGPEGSGKSHLAAMWSRLSGAAIEPGVQLGGADPDRLLPPAGALVVDHADRVATGALAERVLFHLVNLAAERSGWCLLTARTPPAAWPIALADLGSRLRAAPAVAIAPPDDATLAALLHKLFADRGLAIDGPVVDFLVRRMERSFAGAHRLVVGLDARALAEGRAVTRALAAAELEAQAGGGGASW